MSNNRNRRIVPEPPDELVQKALDFLMLKELAEFGFNVETARSIYHKFPELVAAAEFPEHLRAAFVEEYGRQPSNDCDLAGEEVLEPAHRESLLPDAIELAGIWLAKGRSGPKRRLSADEEAQRDAKFLSDLGIADPGGLDA